MKFGSRNRETHHEDNVGIAREIKEIRRIFKMPDISKGWLRCMRCDNLFDSYNTKANRMCDNCRKYNDW